MFLQLLKLFVVEAGWDRELRKEECTHKAIITYTVAFRGTHVVESGCDRCPMLSSPQIRLYEETLAFTWCALKWKGTPLLISACIIYGHFLIGSCWITLSFSFEMCLNLYFGFHFTRLFAVCTSVCLFTPDDLMFSCSF